MSRLAILGAMGALCLFLVIVACAIIREEAPGQKPPLTHSTLVSGTAMTWRNGTQNWAGNPFCGVSGTLPSANSTTVDHGALISGFHCPKPGSALNQPRMRNGDYCQEWYGASPDVGGCEYVPSAPGG